MFQGSITVFSAADAEIVYDELKIFVKSHGTESTINGQVIKLMEPCCKEKKKTPA